MKEFQGENIRVVRFNYQDDGRYWQVVDRYINEGFEIKGVTYGKTAGDYDYTVIMQKIKETNVSRTSFSDSQVNIPTAKAALREALPKSHGKSPVGPR